MNQYIYIYLNGTYFIIQVMYTTNSSSNFHTNFIIGIVTDQTTLPRLNPFSDLICPTEFQLAR